MGGRSLYFDDPDGNNLEFFALDKQVQEAAEPPN
jgi:catechol-2,3-dioxygenase